MMHLKKAWKIWGTDSLSEYEKNSTSILVRQGSFLDLWCEKEMLSGCGDLRPWHQQEIQEAKVQISVLLDSKWSESWSQDTSKRQLEYMISIWHIRLMMRKMRRLEPQPLLHSGISLSQSLQLLASVQLPPSTHNACSACVRYSLH